MIDVRRGRAGEARAIASLHIASRQAAYAGIFRESESPAKLFDRRLTMWEAALGAGEVWVAEQAGVLAGVAQAGAARDADAAPATAELYRLYVAPAAWRGGVGARLLAVEEDEWRRAAYEAALVRVLEANTMARAFYARHGYAPDGCSTDLDGAGLIEIRLSKRLVG